MKLITLLLFLSGCYTAHEPAPDAEPPTDAGPPCDPHNPEHRELCHWRQPEPELCAFTKRGCPEP